MRSLAAALFLACIALCPLVARAQATSVTWQPGWRKVQAFEYVVTAVAGVGAVGLQFLVTSRQDGAYGGVLFDGPVRDLLRAHTRSGRDGARLVGDWGYRSMLAFPFVDVALTWAIHGNDEVAWQMLAIDLEALAVAGLVGITTNHLVGRARPSEEPCKLDPTYERDCSRGAYSSFISGHSVIAAAGAGVTCAHHLSLPLYGGGAGDIAACAATSAIALATGVARMVNDRHWATDVLTAWVVGAGVGYVWPRLFHYRASAPGYAIVPSLGVDAYRALLVGSF